MDEPNGRDLSPDGTDDRSAVLSLLNSDAWQRRLNEARAAREKILAERETAAPLADRMKSATVTRLDPLVQARTDGLRMQPALAPVSFREPEFNLDDLPPYADLESVPAEGELSFDEDEEAADIYAFPFSNRQERLTEEEEEELWAEEPEAAAVFAAPALTSPPLAPMPVAAVAAPAALPVERQPLSAAKISLGFAVGLAAGVAATSLVWFMGADSPAGNQPAPVIAQREAAPTVAVETSVAAPAVPTAIAPLVALPDPAVVVPAPQALAVLPVSLLPVPDAMEPAIGLPGYARVDRWQARPAVLFNDTTASSRPLPDQIAAPMPGVAWNAPRVGSGAMAGDAAPAMPALALAPEAEPFVVLAAQPLADAAPMAALPSAQPPDVVPSSADPVLAPVEPVAEVPFAIAAALPMPGEPPAMLAPTVGLPDAPVAAQLAPHRLTVLAPPSISDAALAKDEQGLRDAGFTLAQPKRVTVTVGETHVRYYHPEDRAIAEVIAARFGGEARDFTGAGGGAGSGGIELWLEGSAPKVAKAKAAKKQKQRVAKVQRAPREDPQISALRQRIVRNLQSASP
ncbi:MAG: hypothetical protein DI533_06050 [Cereibacter sphaeroides]|uniref:SPOR domain-containing protein n=1 Tax=Cereibacter sphaeroides TaxID=1063 RepID=A0A2W5SH62_CERSP|nr:MAG: hypothetical protein DI533_06050 [Cereibacter sphaeroides]